MHEELADHLVLTDLSVLPKRLDHGFHFALLVLLDLLATIAIFLNHDRIGLLRRLHLAHANEKSETLARTAGDVPSYDPGRITSHDGDDVPHYPWCVPLPEEEVVEGRETDRDVVALAACRMR